MCDICLCRTEITRHTKQGNKTMTHKIIILCIEALSKLASDSGNNSHEFNCDLSEAMKSLKKVKKYL
jgi:hypothetical protein